MTRLTINLIKLACDGLLMRHTADLTKSFTSSLQSVSCCCDKWYLIACSHGQLFLLLDDHQASCELLPIDNRSGVWKVTPIINTVVARTDRFFPFLFLYFSLKSLECNLLTFVWGKNAELPSYHITWFIVLKNKTYKRRVFPQNLDM